MTAPANPYAALAQTIDPTVLRSIERASRATSTDFGLLLAQAAQESGFRANAKSATSTAAGLYQFVDSTWLDMVHRFGAKYGAGSYAQQITEDGNGKATVADPLLRKRILDLRQDPNLSAALAGEYTKLNQAEVERVLGHRPQRADLYMAHFLGPSGAGAFLKAVETKGNVAAADLLPEAASANKGIFFDSQTGKARSVAEIYHSLAAKIEGAASNLAALVAAETPPTQSTQPSTANQPTPARATAGSFSVAKLDWSGANIPGAILDILNIVALAALKLTGGEHTPSESLAQPIQTRDRRSI